MSANWLLTGCGSMINEQEREVNASLQVQEKFPLKTDNLVDLQRIPLYNLEATAGLVSLFNDVDAIPISYIAVAGFGPVYYTEIISNYTFRFVWRVRGLSRISLSYNVLPLFSADASIYVSFSPSYVHS